MIWLNVIPIQAFWNMIKIAGVLFVFIMFGIPLYDALKRMKYLLISHKQKEVQLI